MQNEQLQSKKIAFLDRDGVINKKASAHQYITSVDEFRFNKGIFKVLETLQQGGFEFIVITNQRGISRGMLSQEKLEEIHQHMIASLADKGIKILDVFYCPHASDTCDCRKPKPGMLKKACAKYNIDITKSVLISDSVPEVEMGKKFGINASYYVPSDKPEAVLKTLHKKIKIAFVKFGGLSAGGSEKLIQIIAANLSKERFEVDFYFSNAAPYRGASYNHPNTDPSRVLYMQEHNINCIEFNVTEKDVTTPYHNWINTDFWQKFDETKYDIIQTSRAGHKEYPFVKIKKTPIIDILNLNAGVDNQYNIARVMQICNWIADKWSKNGGDSSRTQIISLPVQMTPYEPSNNLRTELGLQNTFVYGMHQRASDDIFSPIPLDAYKKIETEKTAFVLLGGGDAYKKQAEKLGIKNIQFLPATGDMDYISKFLNTLNVYAHGRKDGEVNSQAMAEAMYFGLPIVSHFSKINNGHIECIADSGTVVESTDTYAEELRKLQSDSSYYATRSQNAKRRYAENYELQGQIKRIESIYESVVTNPFPNKVRRFLYSMHWTQNIRIFVKWVYLKYKYHLST